ncbi:hypothetical protein I317_06278 [Kwoniella heveanensis CBS 569]|uniref:Uncharacterized protein n=1 Tax=Kwoniella heveanensis BCC8398 TaxID=1296120 RepID=A0A1B9GVA9_9TREE|nr:hypothetical protein I316_03501 [Kwoniella heveanensis BCC8398]OCF39904.1 hypothetical protein I317_06278 [Kwoniella heveanensis CBS 569]
MSYSTSNAAYPPQPTIEPSYVARQPAAKSMMNAQKAADAGESKQQEEIMRLRGGCPGKFCGLPILPCRCDICIIPIPCC